MKPFNTPILLAAALFSVAEVVPADEISGSLGRASSSVDYYQVECFDNGAGAADHLAIRIIDTAARNAKAVMSVQAIKGILAFNTTDNGRDGNTAYSPWIRVRGGNGNYQVLVGKNRVGADDYSLEYHCVTRTNGHTGTGIVTLQNR